MSVARRSVCTDPDCYSPILNLIFTQPEAWTIMAPQLLELDTNLTSRFTGVVNSSDGALDIFQRRDDNNPVLSTVMYNKFIQLLSPYFNYTFRTRVRAQVARGECRDEDEGASRPKRENRVRLKSKFLLVNQALDRAYSMVDINGETVSNKSEFTIGGYVGLIICRANQDVDIEVTATFSEDNIYTVNGDIVVMIDGVDTVVATKSSNVLVPAPDFIGVAYAIRARYTLCYLPVDVPFVPAPGRSLVEGQAEPGTTSVDLGFGSLIDTDSGYSHLLYGVPYPPANLYISIKGGGDGEGSLIELTNPHNATTSGTYRIDFKIIMDGSKLPADQLLAFVTGIKFLSMEQLFWGGYFIDQNLCSGGTDGSATTAPNFDAATPGVATYEDTYVFNIRFSTTFKFDIHSSVKLQPLIAQGLVINFHKFTVSFVSDDNCTY